MKFQRINEDTIRCIVYKQDMQEYGIVLEDFFKNKSKIHDFLHELVERAEQEVGYTPKEGMLSMQIIPINPNTISITFSENMNENYNDMINNIRDSVEAGLESEFQADGMPEDEELEEYEEYEIPESEAELQENDTESHFTRQNAGMAKSSIIMIGMQSLERMASFCRVLNLNKTVTSELYHLQNKDMYCLIIEKNRLSEQDMRRILLLAVEYTSNITDELKVICHVREYGENIIEKGAYRILRNYV